jgi:predicted DNA binding CopG/RHH family protein
MSGQEKKPWPKLETDDAFDAFITTADLSDYDWGPLEPTHYEFEEKAARVTMRLPESQLALIKAEASKRGLKYQRFMRELMERGLRTLS